MENGDWIARAIGMASIGIALANLAWIIRKERKDRGSLRVSARVQPDKWYPTMPSVPDEIWFEVVNDGKRPAYVREPIGIRINGETYSVAVLTNSRGNFPVKLEPEDGIQFTTPLAHLPLDDMRRLGVVDMTGKRWFAPAADFIDVQRKRRQYQKRPTELPWRARLRARAPLWLRV